MIKNALELLNNISRLTISEDVKLCLVDCVKLVLEAYKENQKLNKQIENRTEDLIVLAERYLEDAKHIIASGDNDGENYRREGTC